MKKICNVCEQTKDLSLFKKDKSCKDGFRNTCKICYNIQQKRYIATCTICGKEFKSHNRNSIVCSMECKKINQIGNKNWNYNSVKSNCCNCKKTIYIKKCLIRNNNFCNNTCYHKWRKEKGIVKGINNPNYKNGGNLVNCFICKKKMVVNNYRYLKTNNFCCSSECKSKLSSLYNKGVNNPNYNPLLSDEERNGRRHIFKHSNWKDKVFKKDFYTCQCCGDNKGHNLNAHHLNSFHWDKKNRYNVENGITLCEDCHKEFHKTYGYKNNTKEQFLEFTTNKTIKRYKG